MGTGLTAGTVYYVSSIDLSTDTFKVSATVGGSVINTSGTQSGSHTWFRTIGSKVGRIGGEETHDLVSDESILVSHKHTVGPLGNTGGEIDGTGFVYGSIHVTSTTVDTSTDSDSVNVSHNNMQPSLVVNYIIKY